MTAVSELIGALVAGGMDAAKAAVMVARAGAEMLAGGTSKGAERTRRWRERKASQSVTERHAVTPDPSAAEPSQTVTNRHKPSHGDIALSSSSFLESQNSREEGKKERAPRGHRIPPDWRPTEAHYREASEQHRKPRDWVDQRATDMRIWAETNSHRAVARKSDWDLTFTGWMRREATNRGAQNGRDESKSVLAAADKLINQFGGMDAARSYVPGSDGPKPRSLDSGQGQASLRLIPKG